MGHRWDALSRAYDVLAFEAATDADEVFRALVLARVIEPASKLDSLRVLTEAGIRPPSYRTMKPVFAHRHVAAGAGGGLCGACRAGAGPAWCSITCPRCTSRPTQGRRR
jgi:hypothetical protein